MKQRENEIWLCAVRYALSRRTYITGVVSEFMIDNIDDMSEKTKAVMRRDIEDRENYGYEFDKDNWMKLLSKLKL